MLLTVAAFAHLVSACSPGDSPRTLAAVASVESGFNPLAIHDNTSSLSYEPASLADAVGIATDLVMDRHHSVDIGLMQINSANLLGLGLTIPEAFDPCRSVQAGATVLRDGLSRALQVGLSRYNTGTADRGFANGYVARVLAASQRLPSIGGVVEGPIGATPSAVPSVSAPPSVVVDMLHGGEVPEDTAGVVNLLLNPLATPTPARQEISAADPGTATD